MVHFEDEKQKQKLTELRLKEEESLVRMLSDKYGIPYIDMSGAPISNKAVGLVDEKEAREALLGAFDINKKTLRVAIFSPINEKTTALLSNLERKGYKMELYMTARSQLEVIWERYKDLSFSQTTEKGVLDVSKASLPDIAERTKTVGDVKEFIDQLLLQKGTHRVSKILEVLIAGAFSLNASDIHTEAQEEAARVRYRLDGVLQDITTIDNNTYRLLLARIKLLSGLKLNIEADTQDGRFSVRISNTELQIRTSLLPSSFGESVVMRLLNPESITVPLPKLGMNVRLLSIVEKEIKKPNGMILTTGPTGSGKTTTLYAFLRSIYNPEIKIITIEDPVEYHIKGVSQTQVDRDTNYTFLSGLRSALRQDPDVIMIGEIRDDETAQIAINAALTGHLVLSTLHTNNAAGAIPRLIDLGVNPKVISSALLVSMAQRLVRRLCDSCKEPYTPEEKERETVMRILGGANKKQGESRSFEQLWRAGGCKTCNNTGYRGRVGVYEAIIVDEKIEPLISENPSERELSQAAEPQKILNMAEDGIMKVVDGATSLDELRRVIDIGEAL